MVSSNKTSLTELTAFDKTHTWTIRNWKTWLGCSERGNQAALYSDKFYVSVINEDGYEKQIGWQIMAFPKKVNGSKDMIAFRLVCLDANPPKGSFNFETITPSFFGRQKPYSVFKSLPLDAAHHWSTCVRYHPKSDLTVKVNVKVVTPFQVKMAGRQ